MARNYYYLVASLREYALDAEQKGFDAVALREGIASELTPADGETLRDFYAFYDVANLIGLHNGNPRTNPLGNLSAEALEAKLKEELKEPDELAEGFERRLWRVYYERCERSESDFLRRWSLFERQLRNICAAWTARRAGLDPATVLVGDEDINASLAHNSSVDFGLKNEVDYIDALVPILENKNLLDKERALDRLRWAKADELTEMETFSLDKVLSVCAKTCLIHRWMALDATTGNAMFRRLVEELTASQSLENKTT